VNIATGEYYLFINRLYRLSNMKKVLLLATIIAAQNTTVLAQSSNSDDERGHAAIPLFTISTVAGTGIRGISGDGGQAIDALIERPTAVALDSKGNLYIANEKIPRVRMVTSKGVITTVVGTDSTEVQEGSRPANETNLSNAYGVATDLDDNLYVLSRGHSKIFKIGADGIAQHIAGTGVTGFSGDGGHALKAQFNFPNHLVTDGAGNLFIADTANHRVRKISTNGVITTVAGTGKSGFSGDGGPAIEAELGAPVAIAIDADGNVYIAGFFNHRIRKIKTDGTIVTIAGTGVPEFNGDGKPALESQIGEPTGVAVDRSGYVYISDQVNMRVRVVTPSGIMYTVAGTGKQGNTGDGGPAVEAQISNPDIIAFGPNGSLFIPDHLNAVVRKLTRMEK
jgi:sugar lactone lactonase YvrE